MPLDVFGILRSKAGRVSLQERHLVQVLVPQVSTRGEDGLGTVVVLPWGGMLVVHLVGKASH